MKIRFIHHSCYTIEFEEKVLIFDYFKGNLQLPEDKDLYFVVTHDHQDHYSEEIFSYRERGKYIVSDTMKPINVEADIHYLGVNDILELDGMTFHGYGSTDEGISVAIEVDGKKIYHSGDLNFWLWPRYMATDIQDMAQEFMGEVDKAAQLTPYDLVMGVVDPRMGEYYHLSGEYFIRTLQPKHFFPLHLWNDFSLSSTFQHRFQIDFPKTKIHTIHGDGESFNITK